MFNIEHSQRIAGREALNLRASLDSGQVVGEFLLFNDQVAFRRGLNQAEMSKQKHEAGDARAGSADHF